MKTNRLATTVVLGLGFFLFTRSAFGLVQLKTELETDSEKISPSVITPEETWADVETDTLIARFKVTPAEGKARVEAEISRNEEGKSRLLGKPSIVVRWDESAEVASSTDEGALVYRLRVVPTQVPGRVVAAAPATVAPSAPPAAK